MSVLESHAGGRGEGGSG